MTSESSDIFADAAADDRALPGEQAQRVVELARLIRHVRDAQLDFLRRHAAEETAEKLLARREGALPDAQDPHAPNRPIKPHRLTFDL